MDQDLSSFSDLLSTDVHKRDKGRNDEIGWPPTPTQEQISNYKSFIYRYKEHEVQVRVEVSLF